MKKMYKKNLVSLMLIVVCLMSIAHGYTQNSFSTLTLGTSSSEFGERQIRTTTNDDGRAIEDRGWNYYDDGSFTGAVGLTDGGSFYWGIMFPAGSYTGNAVTKVKMYDYAAHTGNIMIYQGGTTAPGTLLYTQAYVCTGNGSFVEWTLSAPVPINPNQNLWIVMYNNNGQYVAPHCDDTGNPNGRWISTDGSTWNDLTVLNPEFTYTWMLRVNLETIYSFSWDFENGIPNGWTTIDADGDGYNWVLGSAANGIYLVESASLVGTGHNSSQDMMCSGSWTNMTNTILYPDNYLVSPPMTLVAGSTFSFWACAQDASYASEHFGVFVSNNGISNWTMVNEWTLTAKSYGAMSLGRDGNTRAQGNWYQYSVNLSNFAGSGRYIAIRHFNCSDQFLIDIDDVVLSTNTQYYTISVSASPSGGGTVSGGGTYSYGQSCTVHANAASGYTFVRWTENGSQVSTNANYTFTVTGNRSLVAVFQVQSQQYTINVSASPSNGGTVSGGGTYNHGQSCTVHAIPNTGYTFVRWMENGNQVSTNANYTFAVTSNRNLIAQFQLQNYTINVSANPNNGGTVSGGGTYNYGQSCTVHALPNTGYTFVRWTENGNQVSTNANYTFTVTGNRNLVAQFQLQNYTISVSADPTAGGMVTGGGTYSYGSTCTLHATPNYGYTFVKWTRNGTQVSTSPDYSFTVTANAAFVAYFQQATNNYTINVFANPTNGGTVTGGGTYQQGQQCTITATANNGYTFTNWTENGSVVSTEDSYSFTVNSNRVLVANFQVQSFTITATADPTEGGTITGVGTYNYGDECTLTAIPSTGYSFIKWTKDGVQLTTTPTASFIVSGNVELVAHFAQSVNTFTINAIADPTVGGTVSGDGNYRQDETCTLLAMPNSGYTFVNWTNNETVVSEDMSYTFVVSENATFVAHFTQSVNGYTISVSANPTDGGTVAGAGIYAFGLTCSLTATANEGYKFVNWTENGVIQWMADQYEFVVDHDRTLVANFEALPTYTISAMAGANGTITPQGDVIVVKGADQTFIMTPDLGGSILKVMVDGIDIGPVDSYTFTNVNRNHTIYVSFSGMGIEETQNLNVNIYPNPAKDIVFIEGEEIETVALYDLTGNCLRIMDYNTCKEMNVSGLSKGIYVLMLTTNDGHIGYQKLVLN